ncbi:hypothetical protein PC129_g24144 [Phytophthora cactorum]|uniref:Uncharacterized protein n=1 Tax=Phytophthora cactorum TaxID=29920 RepID=A0A329RC67_9STRA|nr:hypothetical protein Pcac1_g6079 [Phytophthora cactorum]KAG2791333.1 hypothetical protein PC112_g24285 [Phytophthora cactorum]KAG2805969.1 hypothetical protein PC113_g24176 [Phytophthora cactorum]KAG2870924.1 hypothetical protein PC114_g27159 [Phytophthora cactorum]KAG2873970.1 hypothetical protein PC115_g24243 [Phytophthora cactorum]
MRLGAEDSRAHGSISHRYEARLVRHHAVWNVSEEDRAGRPAIRHGTQPVDQVTSMPRDFVVAVTSATTRTRDRRDRESIIMSQDPLHEMANVTTPIHKTLGTIATIWTGAIAGRMLRMRGIVIVMPVDWASWRARPKSCVGACDVSRGRAGIVGILTGVIGRVAGDSPWAVSPKSSDVEGRVDT